MRIPERFPKLKVMWLESGLAWIPFMMQRFDNEYMIRTSEAAALKKLSSDYMRDMYFASQPMEITDLRLLEQTLRVINAETQLVYSSDYPHWDFDLPSTIYDLPFLSETAKRNILGGNAIRLFNLGLGGEKLAPWRNRRDAMRPLAGLIGLCAGLAAAPSLLCAQTAAEFYKSKTVDIYIGTSVGGGYDAYARLLSRHMGRHVANERWSSDRSGTSIHQHSIASPLVTPAAAAAPMSRNTERQERAVHR
jgi:Amidohydrolase